MKKYIAASVLALASTSAAYADDFALQTLTPQETENVFNLFGSTLADSHPFYVTEDFAFTSSIAAYDATSFSVSLYDSNGLLFNQDSLTTATSPLSSFNDVVTADFTEKTLSAGTYTLRVSGESSDGSSAYIGSYTVGRPAALATAANTVAAVPEPETYAMLLAGLGLLGLRKRQSA